MKKKFKNILVQIFCTKIGWLIVCFLLALIFGLLSNYYDWAEIVMYICMVYPFVLALVAIAYGWIINPIRDYKNDKKIREQYKKENENK